MLRGVEAAAALELPPLFRWPRTSLKCALVCEYEGVDWLEVPADLEVFDALTEGADCGFKDMTRRMMDNKKMMSLFHALKRALGTSKNWSLTEKVCRRTVIDIEVGGIDLSTGPEGVDEMVREGERKERVRDCDCPPWTIHT
jgi:hypothetical protein